MEMLTINDLIEFGIIFIIALAGSFAKDYLRIYQLTSGRLNLKQIFLSAITATILMFVFYDTTKHYLGFRGVILLSFITGLLGFQLLVEMSTVDGFIGIVCRFISLGQSILTLVQTNRNMTNTMNNNGMPQQQQPMQQQRPPMQTPQQPFVQQQPVQPIQTPVVQQPVQQPAQPVVQNQQPINNIQQTTTNSEIVVEKPVVQTPSAPPKGEQ